MGDAARFCSGKWNARSVHGSVRWLRVAGCTWRRVRGPQRAVPLCQIARDAGVEVYEGQRFSMTGAASDIMVFGFGNVTEAQIVEGTAKLAHAWRQNT